MNINIITHPFMKQGPNDTQGSYELDSDQERTLVIVFTESNFLLAPNLCYSIKKPC